MCGIAGFLTPPELPHAELSAIAERMSNSLAHRGPDDQGIWVDADVAIGLGHRRLSIVDLSPAGHQPMVSASGRWVISYNGEVYNFRELRQELELAGAQFRGNSDTEVIVEGCSRWGVEKTVTGLLGMFAMAIWDRRDRELHLVRDRLGKKPLYWCKLRGGFTFGSELKALRQFPGCPAEIDRSAVATFFRHGYIPAPETIFTGINKLEPGRILTVRPGQDPVIAPYWSLAEVIGRGREAQWRESDGETISQFEALLEDAVGRRMVADVPVGAFLSGGIDSSTVVALMQANASTPVRTFSIGFAEADYDEATHASVVAKHLRTEHTELYATAADVAELVDRMPSIYDEPFADPSQIPTYLVSHLARRSVTVSLSGDGGDELFAGYDRYRHARRLLRLEAMPKPVKQLIARSIHVGRPATWDRIVSLVPSSLRGSASGDRLYRLAAFLNDGQGDIYRTIVSHWKDPSQIVPGAVELDPLGRIEMPGFERSAIARMQYLDTLTYLPDDILTKLDRASMAVSLECRVPLLDHRIVEFAWRLPPHFKIRGHETKWLLRQVLYRHVPRAIVDRPKMGFGIPLAGWLRGPLRDWAEALLEPARLVREGCLAPAPIRQRWTEHLQGRHNWEMSLWNVLMFQVWLSNERSAYVAPATAPAAMPTLQTVPLPS